MTLYNLMIVESEPKNPSGTDNSRNVTYESSNSGSDACLQDNSAKSSCENNATVCGSEGTSFSNDTALTDDLNAALAEAEEGSHSLDATSDGCLSENFKHDVSVYDISPNPLSELWHKTRKNDGEDTSTENVTNETRAATESIQGLNAFDETNSELDTSQKAIHGLAEFSNNLYEISSYTANHLKGDFSESNCIVNHVPNQIDDVEGRQTYLTNTVGNLEIYGGKATVESEILGNSIVNCDSEENQVSQANGFVNSISETVGIVNIIETLETGESGEIQTDITHILDSSGNGSSANIDSCEKSLCDSATCFENKICDSSGGESLSEAVSVSIGGGNTSGAEQHNHICSTVNSKGNICEGVLPMDNICGSDVPMNDLCGSDIPMTDICEPEIPMGDVCTTEIPMADVSDIAMQDICESDIQMNAICDSDISMNNICSSDIQIGTVCGPEITMSNICGTDIGMNNVCVADISMSNICVASSPGNNICVSDSPGTHLNFAGTSICTSDSPGNICVTDSLANNICSQEVLANNICTTDGLGNNICTAITLENNMCAADISNLCVASVAKNVICDGSITQETIANSDGTVHGMCQVDNNQTCLVDESIIKTEPISSAAYGVCLSQNSNGQVADLVADGAVQDAAKRKRPSRPKSAVPEICTVCNRVFTNSTSLKKHMKTHSGEKPFECDVCKKCFQEPSNLKRHKIIHSGERPFKCKVCEKAFSQSYTLTRHMRTHKPKTEPVETVNAMDGAVVLASDGATVNENNIEDQKPPIVSNCITTLPAISTCVTALPAISTCMTALPSISTCITALPTISTCMTALPTISTVLPTIGTCATVLPTIGTAGTTVMPGNNTCLAVITNNGETISPVGNLCTGGLVNTIVAATTSVDNLGNGLCAADGPTVEIESTMCSPTDLAVAMCAADISKNSIDGESNITSKDSDAFDLDTLRENVESASGEQPGVVDNGLVVEDGSLMLDDKMVVVCKTEPLDPQSDASNHENMENASSSSLTKADSSNNSSNSNGSSNTTANSGLRKKKKSNRSKSLVSEACSICNRVFTNLTTLKKHLKTHTGERPFECEVCHKCFQEPSHLTRHKRIHSGEKPFKCKVCEKAFSQSYTLTRHMRTHSGERPFKCDVCSKAFSQSYTLTVHRRTHSTDRPYECEICHSKFFEASHLTRHFRTHIGEQHFTCELCHKHF